VSGALRPVYLNPGNQAEALGAALTRIGFTASVLKTGAHQQHPCVVVDSGRSRLLWQTEYIYAAPDDDGSWWFWWSSLAPLATERIAPLSDVSVTADRIAQTRSRARRLCGQAG